jgi:hypothetical protein
VISQAVKLLPAALLFGLSGCYEGYNRGVVNQPTQAAPVACKRQEVYGYLTNRSDGDTLLVAPAKLVIDDSLFIAEEVQRTRAADGHFSKLIHLCEECTACRYNSGPTHVIPRL